MDRCCPNTGQLSLVVLLSFCGIYCHHIMYYVRIFINTLLMWLVWTVWTAELIKNSPEGWGWGNLYEIAVHAVHAVHAVPSERRTDTVPEQQWNSNGTVMEHLLFHYCLVEFVRFIVVVSYLMTLCLVFCGYFIDTQPMEQLEQQNHQKNSPDERRWGNNIGICCSNCSTVPSPSSLGPSCWQL